MIDDLKEIGFSPVEARVYLTVLELGGAAVSAIAKRAEVNRVGCYHTLEKLQRVGVVESYSRNNVKHFSAANPELLVNQQEQRLQKAKSLLPDLLTLADNSTYKPKIKYFEGVSGQKKILEQTLDAKGEVLGYTNLEALPKVIHSNFLKSYSDLMLRGRIKQRMLSPYSEAALTFVDLHYPASYDRRLLEVLYINPDEFVFEYEIRIYDDSVAVVSLNPDERIGLIIESLVYAKTQRSVFNLAWLGATSFVAH